MPNDSNIQRQLLIKGGIKAVAALVLSYGALLVFDGPRWLVWLGWAYAFLALVGPQILVLIVARKRRAGPFSGEKRRKSQQKG